MFFQRVKRTKTVSKTISGPIGTFTKNGTLNLELPPKKASCFPSLKPNWKKRVHFPLRAQPLVE